MKRLKKWYYTRKFLRLREGYIKCILKASAVRPPMGKNGGSYHKGVITDAERMVKMQFTQEQYKYIKAL